MTACVECDAATGVVVSGTNAFTLYASYKRIKKQYAAESIMVADEGGGGSAQSAQRVDVSPFSSEVKFPANR
jgi:hypothetical protein